MKYRIIDQDELLICLRAVSFPDGALASHQQLHALIGREHPRNYYGLSYPDQNGNIQYFAAATAINAEEIKQHDAIAKTLKAGKYASVFLADFCNDLPQVGKVFQELIALPDIDPEGMCVEYYPNQNDLYCMVRLLGK